MNEIETKGIVDAFVRRIKEILDPDKLKYVVDLIVRRNYNKGVENSENQLDLSINVAPNKDAVSFISNYTFDNIKGMNDDLVERLRKELTIAIMNNEGSDQIKNRIVDAIGVSKTRAAAIARTESHRAYNTGAYQAAVDSGLKVKKYVFNPSPESDICKHLVTLAPIDINDKWSYKGEEYLLAPFHVNCRSRILYKQVDE